MHRRAYTLVEVMIVVALVGLLAGAVIPLAMARLGEARIEAGGQLVAAAVAEARGRAISTGLLVRVVAEVPSETSEAVVIWLEMGPDAENSADVDEAWFNGELTFEEEVGEGLPDALSPVATEVDRERIASLPLGVGVVEAEIDGPAAEDPEAFGLPIGMAAADSGVVDGESRWIELARVFPDGSLRGAVGVQLADREQARLIPVWSKAFGTVRFEPAGSTAGTLGADEGEGAAVEDDVGGWEGGEDDAERTSEEAW